MPIYDIQSIIAWVNKKDNIVLCPDCFDFDDNSFSPLLDYRDDEVIKCDRCDEFIRW